MLADFFKKTSLPKEPTHPALLRLNKMGAHSAECTMVRTADGRETRAEVGPVSFYRRDNRLFIRDQALFLVPPLSPDELPFSGHGEILNLRIHFGRTPYSLNCEVVQRVRFSDRLLGGLEPRIPVGYKLHPLGNMDKNENRRSLRFALGGGARGPQARPHFRFDLFVEQVRYNGLAHQRAPSVVPFPGEKGTAHGVPEPESAEAQVSFFHKALRSLPEHQRKVHLSLVSRESRFGVTDLIDLGYVDVLGLGGAQGSEQVYLRNLCPDKSGESKNPRSLLEGDVLVLRFAGKGRYKDLEDHFWWLCRLQKKGIENLTLRPRGSIHQQTGLPVMVRDFCVGGVAFQNSPLLETYLMGHEPVPEDPGELMEALTGMGLLLHFIPRMDFPGELAVFQPRIPAAFSLLGEIVRGCFEKGKKGPRLEGLGIAFRHDPVDFDPETLAVTAWEPLRGLRECPHFKEIHRALNRMIAHRENR